jgi:hypothetical protein
MMDGQGRCKRAREMGGRMLWNKYKKWSLRAKKDKFVFFVVEIGAICVK